MRASPRTARAPGAAGPGPSSIRAQGALLARGRGPIDVSAASTRRDVIESAALTPVVALFAGAAAPGAARAAAAARSAGDWTTPGLAVPEDPDAPKFYKTPSGVKVQQLAAGTGPAAKLGDTVLFDYVLRRSNGYFVVATMEGVSFQPRDVPVGPVSYKLGDGTLVPGLEEVLLGMSPGAKVRCLVPPELGYTSMALQPAMPTFATKRQLENHRNEPLLFEVALLRVNNQK